ncbi:HipA domain-containing protein [Niabella hibiscisoli]|nr:HipA domain-containing protein [Niabella hibiscisoli]MCH5719206.1 HipA domain-containing protein [Niabella hibiscisoli]
MDKFRFFELAVFNYVIGNNDMHLKNFSMWMPFENWELSPAYDLLNVKLITPKDPDDLGLNLGGKKSNFNKAYFDRFGLGLDLNNKQVRSVYKRLQHWLPTATRIIKQSFLEKDKQSKYIQLISERTQLFKS